MAGWQRDRVSRWGSAAIALGFLAFALSQLPRYGLGIDSPALMNSGDRLLFFLEHPKVHEALDLRAPDPKGFYTPYGRYPAQDDPLHYPVLPGFLSAVFAQLLHGKLHWLSDLDGRHVGLLLLDVLGLYLFARYACRLFGPAVGLCAGVLLTLYPTAIGTGITNPKDWPSGLYYGVGVMAAAVGLLEDAPLQLVAAGAIFGLSLSAKLNGAFGLVTAALFTPVAFVLCYWRQRRIRVSMVLAWFAMPYLALGVFFVLWPWLWEAGLPDAIRRTGDYFSFMAGFGVGYRPTWTLYPFRAIAAYTPPLTLALGLVGLAVGWRKGTSAAQATERGRPFDDSARDRFVRWAFVNFWFWLIVLRIAAPHSNFYDGNRHFLEYIPALACLAAMGAVAVGRVLRDRFGGWGAAAGAAAAVGLSLVPLVRYHPYEASYFSPLVGGLGAAQTGRLLYMPPPSDYRTERIEGDYWFSAMRDMVRDLHKVLRPGDKVALCGPWPSQFLAAWPEHERIPTLVDYPDADWVLSAFRCDDRDAEEAGRPLYFEVRRGGGLIYRILGRKLREPKTAAHGREPRQSGK